MTATVVNISDQLFCWLKLIRLHQYVKNIFIFFPLFFAGGIDQIPLLLATLQAFVAFCCVTAAVYIFNDIQDIEEDRRHPRKKHRPLAAGRITTSSALIGMVVMFVVANVLMLMVSLEALLVMTLYVVINIAYSLYLKRLVVVDVSIIAVGFVLRLLIGSLVTAVPLSLWIVTMTFLLSLFLALAKRRDDVKYYEATGQKLRMVVNGYRMVHLDVALVLIAMVTSISYVLYTLSDEIAMRLPGHYLFLSSFLVFFGLFRYWFLIVYRHQKGSPIEVLLSDRLLQLAVLLWLMFFTWVLY